MKEFGSHEELLKIDNGRYKELYEMQFLEPAEWFLCMCVGVLMCWSAEVLKCWSVNVEVPGHY